MKCRNMVPFMLVSVLILSQPAALNVYGEDKGEMEKKQDTPVVSTVGTTYYIDSENGSDDNGGTSENSPWETLDKINQTKFSPGDSILFKKGCSWTGQLRPQGSGNNDHPITIGAYGDSDERPIINGNSWCNDQGDNLKNRIFNAAVFFYNQEYWDITSLEITNYDPNDEDSHISKYGVLIMGENAGTLHHMNCTNLYVHNVTCIPEGSEAGFGRGGIIYCIRGSQAETKWQDICVKGNCLTDINHYGINFISTWGSSSFPNESGIPDDESTYRVNSTGIVICNNYLYNIGNAAICTSAYEDALIEYNVCDTCNSGPNGNVPVWWENGDKTIVQYNEVFNSGASDSKEDSQAFDADVNASTNYIQYNYTHDNPSGAYFECPLGTDYTTYIRYNISVNDGYGSNRYGGGAVFTLQEPVDGSKIYAYNNLIYMDEDHDGQITGNWSDIKANPSDYQFSNNVFYTNGNKGWCDTFQGIVKNNAYGGSNRAVVRTDDNNKIFVNETDFESLGSGSNATYQNGEIIYGDVTGYHITESSSCIDSGVKITDNGGKDYFGNAVEKTIKPNIGIDNQYNQTKSANEENDEIIIDFEDCNSGELTGIYKFCDFGNRGWNVSSFDENKVLWATTYTTGDQANKIAIPDDFILTSFRAVCVNEEAKIIVEAGNEGKEFEITGQEQTYLTEFENATPAVYFVIQQGAKAEDIKFDNIILQRKTTGQGEESLTTGKPATASSYERSPSNGNDGDDDSLWVADGDKETVGAWWQVDLEEDFRFSWFEIIFEKDEANAWKFKVEGSPDTNTWDLLWDMSDNTDGSRCLYGDIISSYQDNAYQYLRVTITGLPSDTMWPAFAEFNAYEGDKLVNVALNQKAKASSVENDTRAAAYANDGDEETLWIANGNTETIGAWWEVELDQPYTIDKLEIVFEKEEEKAWKYKVEGSIDEDSWDLLWDQTQNADGSKRQTIKLSNAFKNIKYLFIRVTITDLPMTTMWPAIAEFYVYAPVSNGGNSKEIILTEPGQAIDLDLAYGQPVIASSELDGNKADNVTDRNTKSTWRPQNCTENEFLQINLDREYNVENFQVKFSGGVQSFSVEFKIDSEWSDKVTVDIENAEKLIECSENCITGIKFVFPEPSQDLEIAEVTFDGLDAGIPQNKRILIMAPHEDDEMLMAGGVMRRAIEVGDTVDVVVATNGDYSGGIQKGETRIEDTVNALEKIGVTKEHIFFLGYADTAGLGVGTWATDFTNSFLYKLYVSDDAAVLSSAQGNTETYGNDNVKMDYHYELTGEHARYTRGNFVNDLETLIKACNPTDIYMTSRYDMHFDHAYFGMFGIEAVQDIQKEDASFTPTIHEAIIHSHLTDEVYPSDADNFGYGFENSTDLTTWAYPEGLDDKTTLNWEDRENILVPYAMRQVPYKYNLKDQALRLYTTEYYSWIASFAKVSEVFWRHDTNSIAHMATVTASSESNSDNRALDQSAVKAVDGIADGYATGLAVNHTRFPHAEWVSKGEGKGAWINLAFDSEQVIQRIVLYDRPNLDDQITKAHLEFDQGIQISIDELINDGRAVEIDVGDIVSKNVKLVIDEVSSSTANIGLAEIEVYAK